MSFIACLMLYRAILYANSKMKNKKIYMGMYVFRLTIKHSTMIYGPLIVMHFVFKHTSRFLFIVLMLLIPSIDSAYNVMTGFK